MRQFPTPNLLPLPGPSCLNASYAQFQETAYTVGNGNRAVVLTVVRGDGTDDVLSVNYATADGSAVAGRDYSAVTGTLTWTAGDTSSRTVVVPILHKARRPTPGSP